MEFQRLKLQTAECMGSWVCPVGVDVYVCRLPAGLEITEVRCVCARQVSEILAAAVLKTVCSICQ